MAILQNTLYHPQSKAIFRKAVAFSPSGEINEVVKVFRNGKAEKISSYQAINVGDFILEIDFNSEGVALDTLAFYQVEKVTRLTFNTSSNISNAPYEFFLGLLKTNGLNLHQWLMDMESNQLPAGYGWDGKHTANELKKLTKIENILTDPIFIDNVNIEHMKNVAMVSPFEGLVLDWELAQPIPRDPLAMPPTANLVEYVVIKWHDDGETVVSHLFDEQSITKTIDIDISSPTVTRALVGTYYSTPYGTNIRWKLYR